MKSSEILREARKLVEDGEYCVEDAILSCGAYKATRICERIRYSIYPYSDVLIWLHAHHRRVSKEIGRQELGYVLYNLAFINWMIEGYEATGD